MQEAQKANENVLFYFIFFTPDWYVSTTFIADKFCTNMHDHEKMNPNDFAKPLDFLLASLYG